MWRGWGGRISPETVVHRAGEPVELPAGLCANDRLLADATDGRGDPPGPARQPGRPLPDEHYYNARRRQRRACRRLHRLRGDQPTRGTPALPDRVWSHFGGGRYLSLLAAFERAAAEPLPGHPTGDDNRASGRLVLGYIDRLHQR